MARKIYIVSVMILASLLMAFFVPVTARADINHAADISFSAQAGTVIVPLSFYGQDFENGISVVSDTPFIYTGTVSVPVYLAKNNNVDDYYTGFLSKRFTLSLTSVPPGFQFMNFTVSVLSTDLPDGVSFSSAFGATGLNSSIFDFDVFLNAFDLSAGSVWFYVTFEIKAYGYYGRQQKPTALSSALNCSISFSTDWSGTLASSDYKYELDGSAPFYQALQDINSSIIDQVKDFEITVNANSADQIANDNQNTDKQISAANQNSANEIAAANKNADDIMHSFDNTSQQEKNQELEASRSELNDFEDSLFEDAVSGFSGLNFEDYGFSKFTNMMNALQFVSSFLQSVYVKLGDFGLVVTIGMVVMIASKVIGLYRFSTGDSGGDG